jgi:hypothetical protein
LEGCNEKEGTPGYDRGAHGEVKDPCVKPLNTDPEEEKSNGHLCEDHGPAVEDIAVIPAVSRFLNILLG